MTNREIIKLLKAAGTSTALIALTMYSPQSLSKENSVQFKLNETVCNVSFADNAAVTALVKRLPLKLVLHDLHGNEKYGELDRSLPVESMKPRTIHKGDIMLWSDNTIVVFYKTFNSPYSYTKLGHLDDPDCIDAISELSTLKLEIEP